MDFEAYLNSKFQSPFQVTGETIHPSSSEFLLQDGSSTSESSLGNLSPMVAADQRQFSSNDIHPEILADIPSQANEVAAVPSLMKFDCSPINDDVLRYMLQYIFKNESSKESPSHDLNRTAFPMQDQINNSMLKDTIPVPEPQLSPNSCGDISAADQLMHYLDQRRQKPTQNDIAYWRKFVAKYFDSNAEKRWCFSNYDNVGCDEHFFSHCALDSWNCDLCRTKSGRVFEAKFEVLPRLFNLEFDNGVVDEILFLDFPWESKLLPMGSVMLQYKKAVQETLYKNSRVIHEGQLRVIFTKELKIISWEFCSNQNKVLARSFAPQAKQSVQVSQNYQDNIGRNKWSQNLRPAIQEAHNGFTKVGQQPERVLDSDITKFGLPKQLLRSLEIAQVTDCMTDLFSFSRDNNLSPIESLNRYPEITKLKSSQMVRQRTHQEDSECFISTGYNKASSSKKPSLIP